METTKLSSKGQVIIPKSFRSKHHWESGLELMAVDLGDGILLKPKLPFATTSLDEVVGCLSYEGEAKTEEEIEQACKKGLKDAWNARR